MPPLPFYELAERALQGPRLGAFVMPGLLITSLGLFQALLQSRISFLCNEVFFLRVSLLCEYLLSGHAVSSWPWLT